MENCIRCGTPNRSEHIKGEEEDYYRCLECGSTFDESELEHSKGGREEMTDINLHLTLKERPTDIIVPPLLEKGFTVREDEVQDLFGALIRIIEIFTTTSEERELNIALLISQFNGGKE